MTVMRDHGARAGSDVARSVVVPLYDKQYDAMFGPSPIACIEAASKCGKTYSAELWLFRLAMQGPPGRRYTWLAPSYSQSEMAQEEMWELFASPFEPCGAKTKQNLITLPGERTVHFKTGELPDKLYGPGNYGVVVDEASRVRDEAIQAIYSTTLKTRGPMRLIGNVRGRHNLHYQWSRKGEAGEPGFAYFRLTADDAIAGGVFDQADIDKFRRALPHAVFRELYYCEPSDDGANPFGLDSIKQAVERCKGTTSGLPVEVWGLDIARKRDWTVLIGLDAKRHVAQFHRFHGMAWPAMYERIETLVKASGKKCVFFDATGIGDPVGSELEQRGLWVEPYVFSGPSKQHLMEGLSVALQGGRTTVIDGAHRSEMESFEYSVSARHIAYSAPSGAHDDTVCAHALAWYGAERLGVTEARREFSMGAPVSPGALGRVPQPSRGSRW